MSVARNAIRTQWLSSASVAAVLAVAAAGPAFAQSAPDGEQATVEEVVVTASRISRDGFSAPTPVTTLGAEDIAKRAPSTLGEVLANIPSFRPTNTPNTSGVNSRGGGQITADLRGLGPSRTLVLLDGRRFVPSTAQGTVDLKLIPTLMVNQVDVVTGGASAAWGSDAVAGVVNFILKDRIDGIQGSVQYGQSEYDDNYEYRASLAGGKTFFGDALRVVAGADYLNNRGIGSQYTRPWGQDEYGLITNSAFATNGLPNFIIAPNFHTADMTPGGLVVSGPLRGTAFGPGGAPYQFQYGQVFGANMIGGTEEGLNPRLSANLGAPLEALTSMVKVNYDITPDLSAFFDASLAWSKSGGHGQQPRDQGNLVIRRDNAYLPDSVRAQMQSLGLSTITIGRVNDDTGYIGLESQTQTYRIVGGLKGRISDTWKWDGYYQFGRNRYALRMGPNNRIQRNWLLAVDAVVNPANNQVVCRSTLTSPSNGCIPINVFGNGSAQANAFAFGTSWFDLITEQQVAAFNVQGDVFQLPAGPLSLATGLEWRREEANGDSDPLSQEPQASGAVGAFVLGNQLPLRGQYSAKEVYAEVGVPIVRDIAGFKSLDLNGAVRRTDYSTSGAVTTWKVGFNYQPVNDLRIRGTLSRDIRAPNLAELFQAGGSVFTNVFDPVRNTTIQIRSVSLGNLDLKPEVARTTTVGVVFQPSAIRGFSLAVDYYAIKVDDVIGTISPSTLVSGCAAGVTEYCSSIVFNADGSLNYLIGQSFNLNRLKTAGYDIDAKYVTPLHVGPVEGDLSLRFLATRVTELTTTLVSGPQDTLGQLSAFNNLSGVPEWTANTEVTFRSGPNQVNVQARYVGEGKFATGLTEGAGRANTINDNSIPAFIYWNVGAQRDFEIGSSRFQVYGLINNLFNKQPPMIPSGTTAGTGETSTNAAFYDVIGRTYKVGFRFQY